MIARKIKAEWEDKGCLHEIEPDDLHQMSLNINTLKDHLDRLKYLNRELEELMGLCVEPEGSSGSPSSPISRPCLDRLT